MNKDKKENNNNIIEEFENTISHSKEYYIKSSDKSNIFSLPIQLVYLTLPYRDTKELSWSKSVNDFKLSITSGINETTKNPYGIPFGTIARKLMYLTCTEAVKKQTQTIHLGNTYTEAFKRLGISRSKVDGRTINMFKDQVLRLFFSRINLYADRNTKTKEHSVRQALNLAKGMEFFSNDDKFNFVITLTNDFYEYIMSTKLIPFDYDIISSFDSSPMLMDLYIFLNYKAYSASYSKNNLFVSYEELYQAFGTFSSLAKFKQNIKQNIKKLTEYHKGLILGEEKKDGKDGVLISKDSQSNVSSKEFAQIDMFSNFENNN
ncbi:replication protein RepA [Rickettsiales bacterium LUAb2]